MKLALTALFSVVNYLFLMNNYVTPYYELSDKMWFNKFLNEEICTLHNHILIVHRFWKVCQAISEQQKRSVPDNSSSFERVPTSGQPRLICRQRHSTGLRGSENRELAEISLVGCWKYQTPVVPATEPAFALPYY